MVEKDKYTRQRRDQEFLTWYHTTVDTIQAIIVSEFFSQYCLSLHDEDFLPFKVQTSFYRILVALNPRELTLDQLHKLGRALARIDFYLSLPGDENQLEVTDPLHPYSVLHIKDRRLVAVALFFSETVAILEGKDEE